MQSEMPPEVVVEAAELLNEVAALKAKLKKHSAYMLSQMNGVMWSVI